MIDYNNEIFFALYDCIEQIYNKDNEVDFDMLTQELYLVVDQTIEDFKNDYEIGEEDAE